MEYESLDMLTYKVSKKKGLRKSSGIKTMVKCRVSDNYRVSERGYRYYEW